MGFLESALVNALRSSKVPPASVTGAMASPSASHPESPEATLSVTEVQTSRLSESTDMSESGPATARSR